jgi:hypothetical protein
VKKIELKSSTKISSARPSKTELLRELGLVTSSGATPGTSSLFRALTPSTTKSTSTTSAAKTSTSGGGTLGFVQSLLSGGSGAASGGIGGLASSFLGGGLSPILSGIFSLFGGGGGNAAPPPLTRFALPPSVSQQAGLSGGRVTPVDYGQGGQGRAVTNGASTPNVQIQVNAMDSRSFLDHSDEIAQAVRQAMLSSSSLNDVIADL